MKQLRAELFDASYLVSTIPNLILALSPAPGPRLRT